MLSRTRTRDHSKRLNPFQISYILYLSDYRDLKINGRYVYPGWAYVLGWMMTFSSAVAVPLWVVIHLCSTRGSLREVRVRLKHRSPRRARPNGFSVDFARSSVWLLVAGRSKIPAG